jgi:hypothetical protein
MSTVIRIDDGLYLANTNKKQLFEVVSDGKYGEIQYFMNLDIEDESQRACVVELQNHDILFIIISTIGDKISIATHLLAHDLVGDNKPIHNSSYWSGEGVFLIYKLNSVTKIKLDNEKSVITRYDARDYLGLGESQLAYPFDMFREDEEEILFTKNGVLYSSGPRGITKIDVEDHIYESIKDVSIDEHSLESLNTMGLFKLVDRNLKNVSKFSREYYDDNSLIYLSGGKLLGDNDKVIATEVSNFCIVDSSSMLITKFDGSLVSLPSNTVMVEPGDYEVRFDSRSNKDFVDNGS